MKYIDQLTGLLKQLDIYNNQTFMKSTVDLTGLSWMEGEQESRLHPAEGGAQDLT